MKGFNICHIFTKVMIAVTLGTSAARFWPTEEKKALRILGNLLGLWVLSSQFKRLRVALI